MVRVLHIYKDFYPPVQGGIEKHLNLLCSRMQDQHPLAVLVANRMNRTETEAFGKVPIMKAACMGRLSSAPVCPSFPRMLAEWPADILHFHLPQPTAVLSWLLKKPPGKVVVTWHSDIVRQKWALKFYGPCLRSFLKQADAILPTSPNYFAGSPWLQGVKERCCVIPLGIDLSPFALDDAHRQQTRALCGDDARPLIIFVGRLRYYKGLHLLLEALEKLDARCWIIGDGPERANLQAQISQRKLRDKVELLGELDDAEVARRLHAADIFCLPSHLRSEAFGLSQVEAMACGLPVVSARLDTGVPFVNQDGISGLLSEPGDAASLAAQLQRLIENKELRESLGSQARKRAEEFFGAALMIERINQVYDTVLKNLPLPKFV